MPNKGNTKLDRIIAKSIENYPEIPFNEEAWDKMDAMLEEDERKPFALWWRWAVGFFALFLCVVSAVFFFDLKNEEPTESFEKIRNETSITPDSAPKDKKTLELNSASTHEIALDLKTQKQEKTDSKNPAFSQKTISKTQEESQISEHIERGLSFLEKDKNTTHFPTAAEQHDSKTKLNNDLGFNPTKESKPTDSQAFMLLPSLKFGLLENLIKAEKLDNNRMLPTIPIIEKARRQKRLQLGIVTAGEVNAVGRDGFTRLGLKIGFDLQYRLGEKWKLGTGLSYNLKPYVAYGDEFELPFPWPHGLPATETIGLCDMLEIPLFARYHTNGANNSGWFYGASSVSYVIFQQGYEYIYPTNGYSDLFHYYSTTKNKYYFSGVIEASMGYQFVNKNLPTFQVMPYVQVPLVPVGSGNTKLYSFGLSLRANP